VRRGPLRSAATIRGYGRQRTTGDDTAYEHADGVDEAETAGEDDDACQSRDQENDRSGGP